MIRHRQQKINNIVNRIHSGIGEINRRYGRGPDLYFYHRLLELRQHTPNLPTFLQNDYNIENLYATLVAWGMNSRRATMLYFDEFKGNILSSLDDLQRIGSILTVNPPHVDEHFLALKSVYSKLRLMESGGRLVSNSKLLHFLFPAYLTPMDGRNTLQYFYGNTSESTNKYMEIVQVTFDIMAMDGNWERYLDDSWNTTIPKLIDNAVVLLNE